MGYQTITATIAQSAAITGEVSLERATMVGIHTTGITSCVGYLAAATAPGSAFTRVQNALGSGDFTFALGPGSKSFFLSGVIETFPVVKLETSVAQNSAQSISFMVKY